MDLTAVRQLRRGQVSVSVGCLWMMFNIICHYLICYK